MLLSRPSAKVSAARGSCPLSVLLPPPAHSIAPSRSCSRCTRLSRLCATAASTEASAAAVGSPPSLPPTWFVAVCAIAALLLFRIPLVLAGLVKYVQTGEAITAAFTALVLTGYALFRRFDTLATLRANAAAAAAATAEERAAVAAAAAAEDRAVLLDTNRKAGGFALWRASSSDGLRRLYAAPRRAAAACDPVQCDAAP